MERRNILGPPPFLHKELTQQICYAQQDQETVEEGRWPAQ